MKIDVSPPFPLFVIVIKDLLVQKGRSSCFFIISRTLPHKFVSTPSISPQPNHVQSEFKRKLLEQNPLIEMNIKLTEEDSSQFRS